MVKHNKNSNNKIICIGTSTGGARALQEILSKMPKEINAPIVTVQHMPQGVTKALANSLNSICAIHVKEAEHGEILKCGTAYIAQGGKHFVVQSDRTNNLIAHLTETEPVSGHRPSVNVLFESLSTIQNYDKIAVILTGMGADGSAGLIKLKEKSDRCIAIAESEETCIVFGMPKAAIATNLVDIVCRLDEIPKMIKKFMN